MKRTFFHGFFALVALLVSPNALAGGAGGPIVKGPWMQHVTPTSAIVRVEVDPPSPVTLEVGMSVAQGTADSGAGAVVESREVRALHSILVQSLEPATRYTLTVRARGAQKSGALTTAPREDSGAPFRFLIYGDTRTDDTAHAAVARAMAAAPSDFLVHTGDFVENGASAAQWQTYFDIEAPLLRERCTFSCVGNHEVVDGAGAEYVRYFGPAEVPVFLPRPASSFAGSPIAIPIPTDAGSAPLSLEQLSGTYRWSNARFFLINGLVDYNAGPTRAWLEKVLSDSDTEAGLVWRIVVAHHGLRSSGPHGDNAHLHDANIPALLRAHKVDLVIAGHDHLYERGTSDGLPYLVSGGGGAPVYRIRRAGATSRRYESVRHFVDASASAAAIQLVAIRPDGSTIERCALRKSSGWDCDGADSQQATTSGGAQSPGGALPADTPAVSKSRCGCEVVGAESGLPGRASVLGLAMACAVLAARRRRKPRQVCDNRRMRRVVTVVTVVIALSLAACNTYRDQLVRGQHSFEQNQHERTLGLLRALEPDVTNLATPEQAQYAYLRGMTDYRLGHRSDARHWLSIAKAYDDGSPGLLPVDWKSRMTEALDELNGVVYGEGLAALATTRKPGEESTQGASPPAAKLR